MFAILEDNFKGTNLLVIGDNLKKCIDSVTEQDLIIENVINNDSFLIIELHDNNKCNNTERICIIDSGFIESAQNLSKDILRFTKQQLNLII